MFPISGEIFYSLSLTFMYCWPFNYLSDTSYLDCALCFHTVNRAFSQTVMTLGQGCPNLVLEGHCPAVFSSSLPQHTCKFLVCLMTFKLIKTLISRFRCVYLELELNSAGQNLDFEQKAEKITFLSKTIFRSDSV